MNKRMKLCCLKFSAKIEFLFYFFKLAKFHVSSKSFQVIQGVDIIQGVSMIGLRQNVSFRTLSINLKSLVFKHVHHVSS